MCKPFSVIFSLTLRCKRFITEHFSSLVSWAVIFQTMGQEPFHFTAALKRLVYLECAFPIPSAMSIQRKFKLPFRTGLSSTCCEKNPKRYMILDLSPHLSVRPLHAFKSQREKGCNWFEHPCWGFFLILLLTVGRSSLASELLKTEDWQRIADPSLWNPWINVLRLKFPDKIWGHGHFSAFYLNSLASYRVESYSASVILISKNEGKLKSFKKSRTRNSIIYGYL